MPCLILTGYPSSGKSTLAALFRERALFHRLAVVHVTESTACPDQTTRECYNDSQAEKATRSALKAAFDRAVGAAAAAEISSSTTTSSGSTDDSSKTLIILDSMNYIKGFRYELYCISKAAKERHAVVWVMNDVAVSKQWNENRRQQQQQQPEAGTLSMKTNDDHGGFYTNEQMEELILRYEPPDARNRWDKPLYRVDMRPSSCTTTTLPGGGSSSSNQQQHQQGLAKETLERSVYNMHDLSDAIHLQQETTIHAAPNKKATTTSMGGFKRASSTKVRSSQSNNITNTPATTLALPVESMEKEKLGEEPTQTLVETSSSSSSSRLLSLEERVDAILDSFLNHVQPLQQSFSTQEQLASSDANVLQKVDMLTQQICQTIVTAQNKHVGGKLAIHLPQQQQQQQQQQQKQHEEEGERLWLNYHRDVPLSWPELQRLRKQYMQMVKSQPPRDTSQRGIAQSFLQYIEASAHE